MYLGNNPAQVARQIKFLYDALIESGFNPTSAHELVIAFLRGGGNYGS